MGLFDTTARIVSDRRLEDAQKGIQSLQKWLTEMDVEIKRHRNDSPGRTFALNWGLVMMEKALGIYNEIARCNGAVLVRAIEPGKKSKDMITCQPNGTRCNICGLHIPEGDDMCGNGHEPGKQYPA